MGLTAKDEDASSAMLASWVSQVGAYRRVLVGHKLVRLYGLGQGLSSDKVGLIFEGLDASRAMLAARVLQAGLCK